MARLGVSATPTLATLPPVAAVVLVIVPASIWPAAYTRSDSAGLSRPSSWLTGTLTSPTADPSFDPVVVTAAPSRSVVSRTIVLNPPPGGGGQPPAHGEPDLAGVPATGSSRAGGAAGGICAGGPTRGRGRARTAIVVPAPRATGPDETPARLAARPPSLVAGARAAAFWVAGGAATTTAGGSRSPPSGQPRNDTNTLATTNAIAATASNEPAAPKPAAYARVRRTSGTYRQPRRRPLVYDWLS